MWKNLFASNMCTILIFLWEGKLYFHFKTKLYTYLEPTREFQFLKEFGFRTKARF